MMADSKSLVVRSRAIIMMLVASLMFSSCCISWVEAGPPIPTSQGLLRTFTVWVHRNLNTDIVESATPSKNDSAIEFGTVRSYDDTVRESQDPNSSVIGSHSGLRITPILSSQNVDILFLTAILTLSSASSQLGNGTLSYQGIRDFNLPVSPLAIIGGTGSFAFAKGFLERSTLFYNQGGYAIFNFTITYRISPFSFCTTTFNPCTPAQSDQNLPPRVKTFTVFAQRNFNTDVVVTANPNASAPSMTVNSEFRSLNTDAAFPSSFGSITTNSEPITNTSDPSSAQVGTQRGLNVVTKNGNLFLTQTVTVRDPRLGNGTISYQGILDGATSRFAVTGGTGFFDFAAGYLIRTTTPNSSEPITATYSLTFSYTTNPYTTCSSLPGPPNFPFTC